MTRWHSSHCQLFHLLCHLLLASVAHRCHFLVVGHKDREDTCCTTCLSATLAKKNLLRGYLGHSAHCCGHSRPFKRIPILERLLGPKGSSGCWRDPVVTEGTYCAGTKGPLYRYPALYEGSQSEASHQRMFSFWTLSLNEAPHSLQ